MEEEEEHLFLFQVTVDNIVITDKSCLSATAREGNDRIYVKVIYPDLDWIELDQVDFSSLQGGKKPQSTGSNSSPPQPPPPAMIKVESENQIFFSKEKIICNEGKSFLISMTPSLLSSHFTSYPMEIVLYQSVLVTNEPAWVIASNEVSMGAEMTQLVNESLKHPDLREGPAAMDKQFPLHGAFKNIYGYMQCTLCVSCAGTTAEFGRRNARYMREDTCNSLDSTCHASDDTCDLFDSTCRVSDVTCNFLDSTCRVSDKCNFLNPTCRASKNTCDFFNTTSQRSDDTCRILDGTPRVSDDTCHILDRACHVSDETCLLLDDRYNTSLDTCKLLEDARRLEVDVSSRDNTCAGKVNVTSEDDILDIEKASDDTLRTEIASKIKQSKVSRLIPADNFSYYKGGAETLADTLASTLNKSTDSIFATKKVPEPVFPNNNSGSLLPKPKPLPTRPNSRGNSRRNSQANSRRNSRANSRANSRGKNDFSFRLSSSSDDLSSAMVLKQEVAVLQLSSIIDQMVEQRANHKTRSHKVANRREPSFSTMSNITVPRVLASRHHRHKCKKESSPGKSSLNYSLLSKYERHTLANMDMRSIHKSSLPGRVPKMVKPTRERERDWEKRQKSLQKHRSVSERKLAVGRTGSRAQGPEDFSLSIVRQDSVYHVAIKNSGHQLDNILQFKLYGDEKIRKRTKKKDPLSVLVVPTQR